MGMVQEICHWYREGVLMFTRGVGTMGRFWLWPGLGLLGFVLWEAEEVAVWERSWGGGWCDRGLWVRK